MCSFDGFFINITEEQLNQVNDDGEEANHASPQSLSPVSKKKRGDKMRNIKPHGGQNLFASGTAENGGFGHNEVVNFQNAFASKNNAQKSYRSSMQSLSGRSRGSNGK